MRPLLTVLSSQSGDLSETEGASCECRAGGLGTPRDPQAAESGGEPCPGEAEGTGGLELKSLQDSFGASLRGPSRWSESLVMLKLSGQGCSLGGSGSEFGVKMYHLCRQALQCKHKHTCPSPSVCNQLLGDSDYERHLFCFLNDD